MLRFSRVAVLALLAAAFSGCWEGTTRSVLATVLFVEGPAVISADTRGQLVPLTPGTDPGDGKIIEVPNSSRAGIALLPNLLIELDRNARFEIVRVAITKDGNETGTSMQGRYADVNLASGRMFSSHVWGEASARFTVATPQGKLVTTSNSLFCVESDEHKTRVTAISGTVGFQAREAETAKRIPPGFVGEWSASTSNIIAADTDARAQEDLQEGLDVERKLRFLSSQHRYALPKSNAP